MGCIVSAGTLAAAAGPSLVILIVIPFAGGGTTYLCNLGPLFRAHHSLKTYTEWSIRFTTAEEPYPAGTLEWTSRWGQTHHSEEGAGAQKGSPRRAGGSAGTQPASRFGTFASGGRRSQTAGYITDGIPKTLDVPPKPPYLELAT